MGVGVARWLKPVIYVHAVVVLGVAIAIFLLHLVPLTKQEPVLSSRMGDLYMALAVILVLVSTQFTTDRRWLLVPIVILAAEDANTVIQLVLQVTHANVPTDPMLVPPLLISTVFLVAYVIAYTRLPKPAT